MGYQLLPLLDLQPVSEELSVKNSVPCIKISCSSTASYYNERRLRTQDPLESIEQPLMYWRGNLVLICKNTLAAVMQGKLIAVAYTLRTY